ncbi:MAG TPA: hypothetical protein VFW50_32685 [Streptosporangiaceae bacterium]|nr:hypothetical protein [Streptosporangiaceae bacterium]
MSVKDWVFIVGIVFIFLLTVGLMPDSSDRYLSPEKRKEEASNAHFFYVAMILPWTCAVNFLEFRHGLAVRVGLSDALTWVIAPIGVILVFAVAFTILALSNKKGHWLVAVSVFVLYLATGLGYIAVAVGPSRFIKS